MIADQYFKLNRLWWVVALASAVSISFEVAAAWTPAKAFAYVTSWGGSIVRIVPASLPGEEPVSRCTATVFAWVEGKESYVKINSFYLENETRPVDAVLEEDGRRMMTFDDWGRNTEHNKLAVVIYDVASGKPTHRYSVEDLVPEDIWRDLDQFEGQVIWYRGAPKIDASPSQVTVRNWPTRAPHAFDAKQKRIRVTIPFDGGKPVFGLE